MRLALSHSVGATFCALAVIFGAFGAHALRAKLDPYLMNVYEKGVLYHFLHALALLIVTLLVKNGTILESSALRVSILFIIGIVLFSGSLYLLAITGERWFGAITPVGGVAFIIGWILLALARS